MLQTLAMTRELKRVLFLPGASGNTHFWEPVAARLGPEYQTAFQAYPGFGGVPALPHVCGTQDLLRLVLSALAAPSDLVAQSMGGVLALRAALHTPARVRRLVLTATSGGLDTLAFGAIDWRADVARSMPSVPDWFATDREDLSEHLARVQQPVLLIWGDADPISPLAVGERLLSLLPRAELVVIAGGNHDLAHTHAAQVALHVARWLG